MNKKLFSVVLVLLSVLTALTGCGAKDESSGKKEKIIKERGVVSANPAGYIYDVFTDNTIEISGWDKSNSPATLTIPEKLDDKKVIGIGEGAFLRCALESIELPSSVTSIGGFAFAYCESLKSIKLPSSVTGIETGTFTDCRSLEAVELPSSVTNIGECAFCGCGSLKSLEFPSSLTGIERAAFRGCSLLESVELPPSVTSIGMTAFYGCDSLSEAIVPYRLNFCGDNAFPEQTRIKDHKGNDRPLYKTSDGCKYVLLNQSYTELTKYVGDSTDLSVPEQLDGLTVTSIGVSAFSGCGSLKSIELPPSVTSIGERAFYGCKSLESIKLPPSLNGIEAFMFGHCTSLKSLELPSSVTGIGANAFENCRSLESIVIPASLTNIGKDKTSTSLVFAGCDSLKTIYFAGTEAQWKKLTQNVNLITSYPDRHKKVEYTVVFGK